MTTQPRREAELWSQLHSVVGTIEHVPKWDVCYIGVSELRDHRECRLSFIGQTAESASVETT